MGGTYIHLPDDSYLHVPDGVDMGQVKAKLATRFPTQPPGNAPGTITGSSAELRASPADSPAPTPYRKFQGSGLERAESYMGENLRGMMEHPIDTAKSMVTSTTPGHGNTGVPLIDIPMSLYHRYKQDPAAAAGDVGTGALVSTVLGKPPGVNMAEAGASEAVHEGIVHPWQGLKRGVAALDPDIAGILRGKGLVKSTVGKIPNAMSEALGGKIRIQPKPRPEPAWKALAKAEEGASVDAATAGGNRPPESSGPAPSAPYKSSRTVYPDRTPGSPRPEPAWKKLQKTSGETVDTGMQDLTRDLTDTEKAKLLEKTGPPRGGKAQGARALMRKNVKKMPTKPDNPDPIGKDWEDNWTEADENDADEYNLKRGSVSEDEVMNKWLKRPATTNPAADKPWQELSDSELEDRAKGSGPQVRQVGTPDELAARMKLVKKPKK